jgi:DNA-binding transcriptional regulator YiaG
MKETKKDTLVWEGLGFPIRLINVPMKKVFGEWVLDINLDHLQKDVLNNLARKQTPLTGREIRFIIDYFRMSTRSFAQLFGVSHAAVLKWEKEQSRMNPSTEVCLRLHILNYLNIADKEFKQIYLTLNARCLANAESQETTLEMDADKNNWLGLEPTKRLRKKIGTSRVGKLRKIAS